MIVTARQIFTKSSSNMFITSRKIFIKPFSNISCINPLKTVLCQKIYDTEQKQEELKVNLSRETFAKSFPEILHYINDVEIRETLVTIEKNTWCRKTSLEKNNRQLGGAEKTWIRYSVSKLLNRDDPPVTDEFVIFLDSYLQEKKVI